MRFNTKFEEATLEALSSLSKTPYVILRKEFGENKIWTQCSTEDAFDDILYSDRWGCDDYVQESDSLSQFVSCFESASTWRKTERFIFRFIDFRKIDDLLSGLKKQEPDSGRHSGMRGWYR